MSEVLLSTASYGESPRGRVLAPRYLDEFNHMYKHLLSIGICLQEDLKCVRLFRIFTF